MFYVKISDSDTDSESIEVPTEDDGTISVPTIAAQYPGATGLKYRLDGHVRAVKIADDKLYAPEGGWGDTVYYCVFPRDASKRKADDGLETSDSKSSKVDSNSSWVHTDLVVLGLPWKTTDKDLRDYFSKFGELQLAQVKVDPMSKKSKGYGFVRFADQEVQVRVMLQRHQIDGRWCDVRIPVSKDSVGKKSPYKVFIGQCTEDLTEDILREYFSKFGEISDLYVPRPFRAFAFVTFVEANAAKSVCAQEHRINDTKVYVTEAVPKGESENRGGRSRKAMDSKRDTYGGGGYDNYYNRGRQQWSGREDNDWSRKSWNDEPSYKDNSWRSKQSGGGWTCSPPAGNRWRDSAIAPQSADPNIDPNVVAAVVNKAVLGVIGNLKGNQAGPTADLTAANGGGEWWSRR